MSPPGASTCRLASYCGGGPPFSGEVENQHVTFRFKTGENGRATATLTGVIGEGETTITGKWHLDSDNKDGDFKFKRR